MKKILLTIMMVLFLFTATSCNIEFGTTIPGRGDKTVTPTPAVTPSPTLGNDSTPTGSSEAHTHTFNQEVESDTYKVCDATCSTLETYYKSCSCGEAGTETFTKGTYKAHVCGLEFQTDEEAIFVVTKPDGTVAYKYTCINCGKTETDFAYPNETHTHISHSYTAKDGNYEGTCAICKATFTITEEEYNKLVK